MMEAVRFLHDGTGENQNRVNDQGDDANDTENAHGQIFLGRSFGLVDELLKGHFCFLLFV